MMRAKKNKKKLSDLDNFLESLAVSGDFARAAGSAGVSGEQLKRWFKDRDASDKIALARYKAQMRKKLSAFPIMTHEDSVAALTRKDFVKALRWCQLDSTKLRKERDPKIISLLMKYPHIKDRDGRRKLGISLSAYKMRKKRLFDSLFKHLPLR